MRHEYATQKRNWIISTKNAGESATAFFRPPYVQAKYLNDLISTENYFVSKVKRTVHDQRNRQHHRQ